MYCSEKLNSIAHLVDAVFALVLLYTMSTLYHSFHPPGLKKLFRPFDHVAIYLLIAGTYTPYMLVSLRARLGVQIMIVVRGLAAAGILSEIFLSGHVVKVGQMLIDLGMGWVVSYDMDALRAVIPDPAFYWLLAGGLSYTGGVVCYFLDLMGILRHAHVIWHLFVLFGSCCHFVSIIGYIR